VDGDQLDFSMKLFDLNQVSDCELLHSDSELDRRCGPGTSVGAAVTGRCFTDT
jgi:hypothetical protein